MADETIFDKKNILVIGGAGFIGSHLCDEIVKEAKVVCLDNFLTGDDNNISHLLQDPNFEFINHDITTQIDLAKRPELENFKIEFQGVQEIYFLSSPASPRAYGQYPIETMMVNSIGLYNALQMAVEYKAKFIYVSSPVVYGEVKEGQKVKEDYRGVVDQLGPRASYTEAKRFGETMVNNYKTKFNIDAKIARVFNCYGTRMQLDDGRMIPELIRSAIHGKDLVVYGGESDVASYLYVNDLIQALVKMMDSGESGPLNIASDAKYKFSEVAQKVVEISGSKSSITYNDREPIMSTQILADIVVAKESLGWFPITLLDEGLEETIEYLSAQRGVLEPGQ
jgi:nucleoside-diphosphate-sugar epimerase